MNEAQRQVIADELNRVSQQIMQKQEAARKAQEVLQRRLSELAHLQLRKSELEKEVDW